MIINNLDTLLQYIPNVLATVDGETNLFTKLTPQLKQAEQWVTDHFLGDAGLAIINDACQAVIDDEEISHASPNDIVLDITRNVIATHAYMRAIPKLDVVLTPNGFGIVSNSNIAPASKERVQRLCDELLKERDDELARLVTHLRKFPAWRATPQAEWFAATLFPSMYALCWAAGKDNSLQTYTEQRNRLLLIESDIAATHISYELYNALRQESLADNFLSPKRKHVANKLRAMEADRLTDRPNATALLMDLTQFIRENPDDFPEWHTSATAHLFDNTRFDNQKTSTAYWF